MNNTGRFFFVSVAQEVRDLGWDESRSLIPNPADSFQRNFSDSHIFLPDRVFIFALGRARVMKISQHVVI